MTALQKDLIAVALYVAQFVPSGVAAVYFSRLCRERRTALWLMAAGTFLGFLLAPSIESVREHQIWLDDFLDNRILCAKYTGVGTLVGGLVAYAMERMRRPKQ